MNKLFNCESAADVWNLLGFDWDAKKPIPQSKHIKYAMMGYLNDFSLDELKAVFEKFGEFNEKCGIDAEEIIIGRLGEDAGFEWLESNV